jgi:hypothetical protein
VGISRDAIRLKQRLAKRFPVRKRAGSVSKTGDRVTRFLSSDDVHHQFVTSELTAFHIAGVTARICVKQAIRYRAHVHESCTPIAYSQLDAIAGKGGKACAPVN